MIVALVALLAALGGTAVAGGALKGKKVKRITRKVSRKVSNQQITRRSPSLRVAFSRRADTADAPYAYAHVAANGAVTPASTARNVPNASKGGTGIYCFNLPFAPIYGTGNGSAETGDDSVLDIQLAAVHNPPAGCPAGTDASVRVFDAGALADDDFFVSFRR
jgi:hypothetical protein